MSFINNLENKIKLKEDRTQDGLVAMGYDKDQVSNAIKNMSFSQYLELTNAVNTQDMEKVSQFMAFSVEEGDNSYASSSVTTKAPVQQNNKQNTSLEKGSEVSFADKSGKIKTGEITDDSALGDKVKVKVGGSEQAYDKTELTKQINDLKKMAGIEVNEEEIEETTCAGSVAGVATRIGSNVSRGFMTKAANAGVAKSPKQIAKMTRTKRDKKPGPKTK